ncbi:MAG: hypothetical protein ABJ021_11020, partial [Nitratireductor sp.]
AALLAATAAGDFATVHAASAAFSGLARRFEPEPARRAALMPALERYRAARDRLLGASGA